jgi:hypothetical protein
VGRTHSFRPISAFFPRTTHQHSSRVCCLWQGGPTCQIPTPPAASSPLLAACNRRRADRAQQMPSFSVWADLRVLREPVAVSAVKSLGVGTTNREFRPPFDYLVPGRGSLHSTRGHRTPSPPNSTQSRTSPCGESFVCAASGVYGIHRAGGKTPIRCQCAFATCPGSFTVSRWTR